MLQLPQRLGFNLPNTLSGLRELLADFFQGMVGVHADAKRMRSTRSSRGAERQPAHTCIHIVKMKDCLFQPEGYFKWVMVHVSRIS